MTDKEMNKLCQMQDSIQRQINNVDDVDEFVVLICSTIDSWCRQKKECKYIVTDIIKDTIFETKELGK